MHRLRTESLQCRSASWQWLEEVETEEESQRCDADETSTIQLCVADNETSEWNLTFGEAQEEVLHLGR